MLIGPIVVVFSYASCHSLNVVEWLTHLLNLRGPPHVIHCPQACHLYWDLLWFLWPPQSKLFSTAYSKSYYFPSKYSYLYFEIALSFDMCVCVWACVCVTYAVDEVSLSKWTNKQHWCKLKVINCSSTVSRRSTYFARYINSLKPTHFDSMPLRCGSFQGSYFLFVPEVSKQCTELQMT
jgi:hypothetical protein